MISYDGLWRLMRQRGLKRADLYEILSTNTVAKLGADKSVRTDTIDKLCAFLGTQPGAIMQYVPDQPLTAEDSLRQLRDAVAVAQDMLGGELAHV